MRIRTYAVVVLVALAAMLLSIRPTEGAGKAPDPRHVRWILKVAADEAVLPLDLGVITSLLRSDGVAGAAARDVLSAGSGRSHESIEIEPLGDPSESQDEDVPAMLLSLAVNLPEDAKPVARELGTAIVENLRRELEQAVNAHLAALREELKRAEAEEDAARGALSSAMKEAMPGDMPAIRQDPADEAVHKQLDTLVDLSALNREQSFGDAIELIRRQVEPPLQITVLWRELLDNAQIEPCTLIQMDGLTKVKLGTGLKNLLEAMSNPQLDIRLNYVVAGGVITIGTDLSLPQGRMETRIHEVPAVLRTAGQVEGLEALIQQSVEPDSWLEFSERGEGTIIPCGDTKLIVRQTPQVHQKVAELLQTMAQESSVTLPVDASRDVLEQQTEFLLAYRDTLEQEIDKLQDRQRALARERENAQKQAMEHSLRMVRDRLYQAIADLNTMRSRIPVNAQDSPDARALGRAIERIKQCADMSDRSVSGPEGDYVTDLVLPSSGPESEESRSLSMRLAAKQGESEQVSRRIAKIQGMLTGQTTFDPQVHGLHLAAQRLEPATTRVHHLERQIRELYPCIITILGDSE